MFFRFVWSCNGLDFIGMDCIADFMGLYARGGPVVS